MDADSSNYVNFSISEVVNGWPVWSPDGSIIAFTGYKDAPFLISRVEFCPLCHR